MVKRIHDLCTAADIPFVIVPVYKAKPEWLLSWPLLHVEDPNGYRSLPNDGHPSPASNAIVAGYLAEALRDLVPAGDATRDTGAE